jgi:uncharacterized protein (DUF2252 family)
MTEIRPQAGTENHLERDEGHAEASATAQAAPTSVEPVSPQDAQAAGAATGQQNDLLQGNVSGSEQEGAAEKAKKLEEQEPGGTAGVHSTGSYTGSSGGR